MGGVSLSADQYHADELGHDRPSLSASIAHTLVTSSPPARMGATPQAEPRVRARREGKFDVGTSAHELLLRGTNIVEVVDAADWRTKAAKEAAMVARAAGKVPLLAGQWERVQAMIVAGREQMRTLDVTPGVFVDGQPEQTLVWEDEGVLCRARVDWLHDDLLAIDDYKTTKASAEPEKWSRSTMYTIGADVQVAFYLRGLELLHPGAARPDEVAVRGSGDVRAVRAVGGRARRGRADDRPEEGPVRVEGVA
jgi:hypothetical protein